MKKLNFLLYSDGEEVINFEAEYSIKEGYVCFSDREYVYKIRAGESPEFRRSTTEDELVLKEGGIGYITLKNLDKTFEIELSNFVVKKADETWVIEYELESDKEVHKIIELHFVS